MRMTAEEARRFKERWELVNRATLQESQRKTPEERLAEVGELLHWVAAFEDPLREAEATAVRDRWVRLHLLARG